MHLAVDHNDEQTGRLQTGGCKLGAAPRARMQRSVDYAIDFSDVI
jgi:hypothetical protein